MSCSRSLFSSTQSIIMSTNSWHCSHWPVCCFYGNNGSLHKTLIVCVLHSVALCDKLCLFSPISKICCIKVIRGGSGKECKITLSILSYLVLSYLRRWRQVWWGWHVPCRCCNTTNYMWQEDLLEIRLCGFRRNPPRLLRKWIMNTSKTLNVTEERKRKELLSK